jgi:2'-5' RNA ligase
MRLFIACMPSPQELEQLASAAARLRADLRQPDLRWIEPANWHFTLAFLGATPAQRVDRLVAVLRGFAADEVPVAARVAGVMWLPSSRAARVLALRVESQGRLEGLVARLRAALAAEPYEFDHKPFRAHVTLARAGAAPIVAQPFTAPPSSTGLTIDHLCLVSSEHERHGSRYRVLARFACAVTGDTR